MKKSITKVLITTFLAIATLLTGSCKINNIVSASSYEETSPVQLTLPLAVTEQSSADNLLPDSDFESEAAIMRWKANGQTLERVSDSNGSYMVAKDLILNHTGFNYDMGNEFEAGTYKFSGWFRTAEIGHLSRIRVIFFFSDNTNKQYMININNEWQKVDAYIDSASTMLSSIKICGGPDGSYIQPYCMDNFSLVKIQSDEMPSGIRTVFGNNVTPLEATESMTKEWEKYNSNDESVYKVNGIIINQDADGFLGSCANGNFSVNDLIAFAKQYEGSQITDYMICINNTNASYPSDVWTDVLDKYYQTVENGIDVDYSQNAIMKGAHYIFETLNTDYIALWIDALKEININPWLSVRMNDAHDHTLPNSQLLSDFYHNHPEIRRVQHHSYIDYFDNLMDYSNIIVRDYVKSLINEALSKYDTYGLELDFQREIKLFSIGGEYEGIEIMNTLMREIDQIVEKYEQQYGHEIKIAVRVASDVDVNLEYGLDVMTWVSEGIVDMVSPSGRWATTDNDMPIRLWSSLLKPYENVVLAPCIETNICSTQSSTAGKQTLETISGSAANILSQGADKVYLFNQYRVMGNLITDKDKVTPDQPMSIISNIGYWNMITTVGSYDKLMSVNRRSILTYDDTYSIWNRSNAQLPRSFGTSKFTALHIAVGDIKEGSSAVLKISSNVNLENAIPTVYVNSKPCTYVGYENCDGEYTHDVLYCFEIPSEAYSVYITAEIKAVTPFTTNYAEVYIKNAD